MPIYEYKCRRCNAVFEVLVQRDADVPATCRECGAPSPVKAFSTFGVTSGRPDHAPACETCPSAGPSCGGGCPRVP